MFNKSLGGNMQEKRGIKINLFGTFTMEYQNNVYNLDEYLTKQSLNVLKIFVLNYKKPISNEWIMQLLWKESENPANSLKYSIFRLRKSLKNIPTFENENLINTTNEGYELNPTYEFVVDTYEFQREHLNILNEKALSETILPSAELIDSLYKGSIKVDSEQVWFMLISEYYRSSYLETVKKLCDFYLKNNYNEKLKITSIKAASLEPMIEENHFYYIQSLINLREANKAFQYYQKSTKMLIDEYALALSDKMITLYDFLIDGLEKTQSYQSITEYFKNKEVDSGALYCNNSIFDYIYDIHLREARRSNQKYYLFAFEVKSDTEFEDMVSKIKICFQNSLRSSDVFTRITKFQFLVLLPCEEDELAHMIARRISGNFRKKFSKEKASLFYHLENIIK